MPLKKSSLPSVALRQFLINQRHNFKILHAVPAWGNHFFGGRDAHKALNHNVGREVLKKTHHCGDVIIESEGADKIRILLADGDLRDF